MTHRTLIDTITLDQSGPESNSKSRVLSTSPELKPHHQMQFSVIPQTSWVWSPTLLKGIWLVYFKPHHQGWYKLEYNIWSYTDQYTESKIKGITTVLRHCTHLSRVQIALYTDQGRTYQQYLDTTRICLKSKYILINLIFEIYFFPLWGCKSFIWGTIDTFSECNIGDRSRHHRQAEYKLARFGQSSSQFLKVVHVDLWGGENKVLAGWIKALGPTRGELTSLHLNIP